MDPNRIRSAVLPVSYYCYAFRTHAAAGFPFRPRINRARVISTDPRPVYIFAGRDTDQIVIGSSRAILGSNGYEINVPSTIIKNLKTSGFNPL
jgi:hypothetical protein